MKRRKRGGGGRMLKSDMFSKYSCEDNYNVCNALYAYNYHGSSTNVDAVDAS